jgi:hypothetical protein
VVYNQFLQTEYERPTLIPHAACCGTLSSILHEMPTGPLMASKKEGLLQGSVLNHPSIDGGVIYFESMLQSQLFNFTITNEKARNHLTNIKILSCLK